MKKRIALLLTTGVFFAGGIFFWTLGSSSAQENPANFPTDSTIIQKLDALIGQLSKLTDLISVKKEEKSEDDINNIKDYTDPPGNPAGCGKSGVDFESWDQSYYRKVDSNWNLSDFPTTANYQPYEQKQFLDINGDGLLDYIYMYKYFSYNAGDMLDGDSNVYNINNEESCILLNNGHGWDIVYKCKVRQFDDNGIKHVKYYGDCADTSKK